VLEVVRRYARLALWTVVLVLGSGVGAALAEFDSLDQLLTTAYGRVLLVKAVLVGATLALALRGRFWGVRLSVTHALPHLRRLTRGEAGSMVAVLAASALLGNVAPPFAGTQANAVAEGALLGAPPPAGPALHLAGQAGWLEVYVTASTGQLAIEVLAPGDDAPQGVHLTLSTTAPVGKEADLFPRSCGPGCFFMSLTWHPGTTALRLRVAAQGWAGGLLSLAVPWPPGPVAPHQLAQVLAAMHAQKSFGLDERVSSGPGAATHSVTTISGPTFIASEPFSAHVTDVRRLPASSDGLAQLLVSLPGARIWAHLWIDAQHRLRREVIVAPGYLITRTFSYPVRVRGPGP
jgi:hypothetical protein